MADLRDTLARMDVFSKEIQKEITDIVEYGGTMGSFNLVVELLTTIIERVRRGDKIEMEEKSGEKITLTDESLKRYITGNFPEYIIRKLHATGKAGKPVYFNIENSASGLDLIYSSSTPNKLFKWIADIDEEYTLMELLPTHVVYIRHSKTRQIIPYLSEHNNCYVYDEAEGKIKEVNIWGESYEKCRSCYGWIYDKTK